MVVVWVAMDIENAGLLVRGEVMAIGRDAVFGVAVPDWEKLLIGVGRR